MMQYDNMLRHPMMQYCVTIAMAKVVYNKGSYNKVMHD